MTQEEIQKIKDRAVDAASRIPMTDILRFCGYTGKLKKRGSNIYFECPNGCEADGNMSRCSINENKNLAYCFCCKQGWGPALYTSQQLGINYIEAALILAKGAGEITEEECEQCNFSAARRNKLVSDSHTFKMIEIKKAEQCGGFKAPAYVVDCVYRHMLELPELTLSCSAFDYLVKKRHLSDDEIRRAGFFSYESCFSVDTLVQNIKNDIPGFSYNQLAGVPGFYFVFTDKEKTRGKWKFRNPYKGCIGIPLMDSERRIVALQMRFFNDGYLKNGIRSNNKYFFVTSSSVGDKEVNGMDYSFGASPGTPAHVEYPDRVTNPTFLIGEGKFKMMEAAKEGSVSFSCQGVGNYVYVVEEIAKCLRSYTLKELMTDALKKSKPVLSFIIMYDSDIFRNYSVLVSACELAAALKKKFGRMPYFLLWDEKYGKGFDDMKVNLLAKGLNYKDFCFVMEGEKFTSSARTVIKSADSRYHRDLKYDSPYSLFIYESLWTKCVKPLYDAQLEKSRANICYTA